MHWIQALISREHACRRLATQFSASKVVLLAQGFAAIPVTRDLVVQAAAAVTPSTDSGFTMPEHSAFADSDEFKDTDAAGLSREFLAVAAVASGLSAISPVAYVATRYSGGDGCQAAVAWTNGCIAIGPATDPKAINTVLRHLGVSKGEALDEFEALGLGRFRSLKAMESAATQA